MNDNKNLPDNADEHATRSYTHDYPNDTVLEYSRTGENVELLLSFTSEDTDMGTEVMLFSGDAGESLNELAHGLREEITSYLDREEAHERPDPSVIHSSDDYYSDFSRTSLYAFENALKEIEQKKETLAWQPIPAEKSDWLYSDSDKDEQRGCVGHLRGDFGRNGDEFWTSWFDHQRALKKDDFITELQTVVNDLRKPGGLLNSFSAMNRRCYEGKEIRGSYGFHAESQKYEYCLRCNPMRGDYNFYLYSYSKEAQREHAQEKPSITEQLKTKPTHAHTGKENRTNEKER